jgi:methionyl-tRNA formyltransferase
MDRCIIFGDSNSLITNILLDSFLNLNKKYKQFEIICIVDTQKNYKPKSFLKLFAIIIIKALFNKKYRSFSFLKYHKYLFTDLYKISKKYRIRVVYPSSINSEEFLSFIEEVKPNIGIAIGCPQIFKPETIKKFEYLVNYHNSLLPKYKGLGATAWSVYYGEQETGFTFHKISENIDEGNILVQDSIPINIGRNTFELEIIKTKKAADKLEELFEKIVRREEGIPQSKINSYFGKKELEQIILIESPENLTTEEILKRLKAFEILKININGKIYPVTDVSYLTKKKDGLIIKTKDGFLLVKRILYMPVALYKLYELLKQSLLRRKNE